MTEKLPDFSIETERLLLREFRLSDSHGIFELNGDPEVIRYTGDEPFADLHAAEEFLRGYAPYASEGFGRWAVLRRSDDAFLGFCGLRYLENGDVDLGYRFMKKYWGQGYATESARACLDFAFLTKDLPEVIARVSPDNVASIHVLEKLGMHYYKKDYCGGIPDSFYYKITSENWKNRV